MGRKIPAKKHRGVKDPLKQQAQRFQKLKTKINAPPTDPDEQPVPRSLTRLFAFRDIPEKSQRKRHKKASLLDGTEQKERKNPVKKLQQLPGESGRAFSLRINSAVRQLADPDDQLDYPVDIEENDIKGQRMLAERERRQIKRRKKEKEERIARGEPKKKTEEPTKEKPHRMDIKKAYKKAKAEERAETRSEVRYERVAFGEVAAAPPALPAPRRAAPRDHAARPGRRQLLLSGLLQGGDAGPGAVAGAGAGAGADEGAGARLAAGARALDAERRERARLAAVDAYRALKRARTKQR